MTHNRKRKQNRRQTDVNKTWEFTDRVHPWVLDFFAQMGIEKEIVPSKLNDDQWFAIEFGIRLSQLVKEGALRLIFSSAFDLDPLIELTSLGRKRLKNKDF